MRSSKKLVKEFWWRIMRIKSSSAAFVGGVYRTSNSTSI
jgi:hypothetical protein